MLLITFKYIIRLVKCLVFLLLMIILIVFTVVYSYRQQAIDEIMETTTMERKFQYENVKFILLWTDDKKTPFRYLGKGSSIFKAKSCKYTNCFITPNRLELGDTILFDAVLFNGPQLPKMLQHEDFPKTRSMSQKYVYANVESSQNYPICTKKFNGFFNWTWTYRLNSDANWGYFVVRNKTKHVIAPKLDVKWTNADDMDDIDEKLKAKLKLKGKAVAWFSSNCHTKSRREDFVNLVRQYLKKMNLDVHIYGKCGSFQCPAYLNDRCLEMLDHEYYFYFAFENALSEDYVTEKVLNALKHNTVPVVYGGANYSRFLPPGSYINAMDLGPEKLANTIDKLMKNPQEYYKYFRWQNHYSIHYRHESPDTDDYCKFCKILNDRKLYETVTVHDKIDEWWNDDVWHYGCDKRIKKKRKGSDNQLIIQM